MLASEVNRRRSHTTPPGLATHPVRCSSRDSCRPCVDDIVLGAADRASCSSRTEHRARSTLSVSIARDSAMGRSRTRNDANQKCALNRRFAYFAWSAPLPHSHNPKVAGSTPAPATTEEPLSCKGSLLVGATRAHAIDPAWCPAGAQPMCGSVHGHCGSGGGLTVLGRAPVGGRQGLRCVGDASWFHRSLILRGGPWSCWWSWMRWGSGIRRLGGVGWGVGDRCCSPLGEAGISRCVRHRALCGWPAPDRCRRGPRSKGKPAL